MGVKLKIKYAPSGAGAGAQVPGAPNTDNVHLGFMVYPESVTPITGWTNFEGYLANNPKHVMSAFVTPTNTSGKWGVLQKYFRMSDYFSSRQYFEALQDAMMVCNSGGGINANPAKIVQGQFVMLSQNSSGCVKDVNMSFQIYCTFYVEFDQVRLQQV